MSIIVDNNTPIFTGLSSISTSNVIFSGGNVGIGTTTPVGLLNLRGYTGGTAGSLLSAYTKTLEIGGVYNQSYNTGNSVLLHIGDYSNDSGDDVYPIYMEDENNIVDFYINAGNTQTAATKRAYFGGNVGIGTTSPASKLDVNGNTAVTGTITSTGNIFTSGNGGFYNSGSAPIGFSSDTTAPGYTYLDIYRLLTIRNTAASYATLGSWSATGLSIAGTLDVTGVGSLPGLKGQKTTAGGGFISSIDEGANVYNVLASRNNANSAYLPLSIRGGTITIATSSDIATFSSSGNVGIGTASPVTKLHVNAEVSDDNSYAYDTNSLYVVHQTPTSTTTLNDPQEVMLLARQGTGGQAYGAAASFRLSRYENSSVNSRTRMDIVLAHNSFLSTPTTVMTIRSDGNVGIGTSSPVSKLHVAASTPTSLGSLPSGVTAVSDSSTNNYLLFRNTADNGTYSGIAFQDNNIGGYVIFGNAGGGGDLLYLAGYGGGQLQYGSADSIAPGSRTTVASWSSTGFTTSSPLLPTGGIIGNTINYTTSQGWAAANPTSTQTGYFGGDFTGNGSASENKTTYAVTPYLSPGLTWASINDAGSDADGGWNKSITGLVSTKTYRSMVWVRRTNASTNGNFYLGCDGGNTLNLSNVVDTNPYFFATGISTFTTTNRWYLAVGYIHAYGDGSTTSYSKIYDSVTGQSILTGTDYKMVNGATAQTHRTYFFYSTDTNSNLEWWGPRFEEVNGNEPTIGAMLAGSITTPTYSGGVSAPIYYDSDNTAFYGDFASTSNINILAGNGKTALETADTYLRINQSSAFSNGIWFGNSNQLSSAAYGAWGSNGGTTTSRVWIQGGTYNGSTVISLNGSTGDITSAAIIYALTSSRSPIFYDYNDTTYYVDPNSTSSMWNVNIRGDLSAAGTSNQVFFYGVGSTTTSAIGFKNGGQFASPTGNGDGWNTYLSMDTAGRGWVFRQATGGTDFTSVNNSGWILNNGIWQSNGSMRAPIFYDSNDTNYYCDPNSTSRLNQINYTAMYNAADTNYGVVGNNAFFDTVNSGAAGDQLELCYVRGTFTSSSGSMRTPIFYDRDDTTYYGDFNSDSNWQGLTVRGKAQTGLTGQSNWKRPNITGDSNYWNGSMGWGVENFDTVYSWGTGFFDTWGSPANQPSGTSHWNGYNAGHHVNNGYQMTMGAGDPSLTYLRGKWGGWTAWYKVAIYENNNNAARAFYASIYYDSNNTGYYSDPASTSNINQLNLAGSINATGNASYQYYFAHGNNSRLVLPAGNNGAGSGQAVLNMWISEPGVTWTASGIARNRTNDGGAGGFGRINTSLSSQMIRFDEGNSILFYTGNNSGTFWQPFYCTDDYAYSNASLRAPIFYDNNDTAYYVDPNGTSQFNNVRINYVTQDINFQAKDIYDVNSISTKVLYDHNNTYYYLDPSASSRLSALRCEGNEITIQGSSPTIGYQDTDGYSAFHHCNSDVLYILRGCAVNAAVGNWCISGSAGNWPMQTFLNGTFGVLFGTEVKSTGAFVSYYSDDRLKTRQGYITNAIDKIKTLSTFYFVNNDLAKSFGFTKENQQVGCSAQEIEAIMPQVVSIAPFDMKGGNPNLKPGERNEDPEGSKSGENYKTVDYSRLVPLLIAAIKEQQVQIDELRALINN